MPNMFKSTLASSGGGDGADLIVTCAPNFAGSVITCTDGSAYTKTQTCPSSSPYEVTFESIPPGTYTISGVVSGRTFSTTKTILDFDASLTDIPDGPTVTPTDDIQIWLHCADIWDKSYSTISEVLTDASTLQALIASNNAADYMARSTTWASSVTADSNAMSYIGLNDYCSAALLADSTWLSAICNSAYFESILNVKVPTMTSATAPYGVVSASSYHSGSSNYPYLAFDGNAGSYWKPSVGTTNSWLCYEFENAICVNMIYFSFIKTGSVANPTIIFQGSNDGNTWTDITNSITLTSATNQNIISTNRNNYKYYRLYNDTNKLYPSGGNFYNLGTLQFYGRA